MKLFVKPFKRDSEEATFRKIHEEMYEVAVERTLELLSHDGDEKRLKMEVGDLLTAIVNWCQWAGLDVQECLDLANTKNVIRGYYDTMDS